VFYSNRINYSVGKKGKKQHQVEKKFLLAENLPAEVSLFAGSSILAPTKIKKKNLEIWKCRVSKLAPLPSKTKSENGKRTKFCAKCLRD